MDSSAPYYWSPANKQLGVAVANVYNTAITVQIAAIDSNGNQAGNATVPLGPFSHVSFNLSQFMPSISNSFTGSVQISSTTSTDLVVAWTLNVDSSGVLSSLPPGALAWPISHFDRISLVFNKILNAAQSQQSLYGVDLTSSPPTLQISSDRVINSFGGSNGITIYYSLSELISDSASELAFIIGHEFGHIIQGRLAGPGGTLVPLFTPINPTYAGIETDADRMGLILSLTAGYDPYAAAGALAKFSMATGTAGLGTQSITDVEFVAGQLGPDPHPSWGTRIDLLFQTLTSVCTNPQYSSVCTQYKSLIHPHFPPDEPLSVRQTK